MAPGFPCPNPACSHRFSTAQLTGADALKCPRCGHVFQLRATPTVPAPIARPVAAKAAPAPPLSVPRAVSAIPVAPIAVRDKPVDVQLPANDAIVSLVLGETLLQRRKPAPRRAIIIVLSVLIGLGAFAPVIYFALRHWLERSPDGTSSGPVQIIDGVVRNASQKNEVAFRLALPKDIWKPAATLKQNLQAVVAVQRSEPDVWLAVLARDYGTRKPRDAELVSEAMERLVGHFGDLVAFGAKPEVTELAGQRAQRLEFKGTFNSVWWRGECQMFSHQGLGYWLFIAAPDLATAQKELAELQRENGRGLVLAAARQGWTEQPPEMDAFRGSPFAFEVKAPKGVWLGGFDARDVDKNGVLYLVGRDLKEKDKTRKNLKNAFVLVSVQDNTADAETAMKTARAALDEKVKIDGYKVSLAEPGSDDKLGTVARFDTQAGRIVELCVSANEEPKRFVVLAVTALSDRAYVFHCECAWEYRPAWRSDFLDLLATLRVFAK